MYGKANGNNGRGQKSIQYGDPIVGVWRCRKCRYECFPRRLRADEARPPFLCPKCRIELYYDEEA
jgi:rubrerythrin